MASRCSSCTAALPRVARFCPRCGLPTRRPPGQPLALVVLLAAVLIVLSNLTMRAVTIGSTSGTHVPVATVAPVQVGSSENIENDPLVLLDRDIAVRDLRLHGVRVGDARTRVPRRFVTRTSAGDLRCYDGNAYECRDGVVTRIVLNDPAILLRLPCRECLSVFSSFGAPDEVEDLGREDRIVFRYASRGMSVRWNRRTSRIDQIILSNPE